MEKINKKVFVTKNVITGKIYEIDAMVNIDGRYAIGKFPGSSYDSHFNKNEYFDTMEEAIKNANERIQKKIKSLNLQIEKLEKKKF